MTRYSVRFLQTGQVAVYAALSNVRTSTYIHPSVSEPLPEAMGGNRVLVRGALHGNSIYT